MVAACDVITHTNGMNYDIDPALFNHEFQPGGRPTYDDEIAARLRDAETERTDKERARDGEIRSKAKAQARGAAAVARTVAKQPVDMQMPSWGVPCSDDPDLFFRGDSGHDMKAMNTAKAICASCPEEAACLATALEQNLKGAIYGGLTTNERTRLRRRGAA